MSQDEEGIKQLWAKLVAQSWTDEKLRQRLLEDPAAVLKENFLKRNWNRLRGAPGS